MKIRSLLIVIIVLIIVLVGSINLKKTYAAKSTPRQTSTNQEQLLRLMQSMDKRAAASGDKLSMANVANLCLEQKDYACAYKIMLISLTSSYWWTDLELPTHVLDLHDKARDALSDQEADIITKEVKIYFA